MTLNAKTKIPAVMHAVQLIGHGGMDKLVYKKDVPVPQINEDEVLIRVHAAGVNNTDINTRIGWYSKSVTEDTNSGSFGGIENVNTDDAGWSGVPLVFPRIQGADVCGKIVAVGKLTTLQQEPLVNQAIEIMRVGDPSAEVITGMTSKNGRFQMPNVQPGRYEIQPLPKTKWARITVIIPESQNGVCRLGEITVTEIQSVTLPF